MEPPAATYRLQLDPTRLDFEDARALLPYLERLGISHLYLSPIFAARPGSPHGYDVVDPTRINPELGGRPGFEALAEEAVARGIGIILDLVPNHMAAHHDNRWWWAVLEQGPDSPAARFFDIDWGSGPLLLPVLGDPYAEVLERGDLVLALEETGLVIRYHEHRFPVTPSSYPLVLGDRPPRRVRRADPGELADLAERKRRVRAHLEERLAAHRDPDLMDTLIEAQHYRPVHWELSLERLSHRRFFDILHLVGVRVEDPEVFSATHTLALELVQEGLAHGLRIDHVDGLRDPTGYLQQLHDELAHREPPPPGVASLGHPPPEGETRDGEGAGGRGPSDKKGIYLVVEKILAEDEDLPVEWPVEGTTGYELLSAMGRLFVDSRGLEALRRTYLSSIGTERRFPDVVYAQKRRLATERFAAELGRLEGRLHALAARDREGRDVPPSELTEGLVEVTACLPVYRTYTRAHGVTDRDRAVLERAFREVRRRRSDLDERALGFLERVLAVEEEDPEWLELVLRWQQLSGALMAKGMEDTALYVHVPLLSLNEVGSHPEPFPSDPLEAFHLHNQRTTARRPRTMTTLSTHDTKRSEDVRARLHVLSHIPERWGQALERWTEANRHHKREAEGHLAPTPDEEVLLYQTLVGAWPLEEGQRPGFRERLEAYLVKAAREAKVHTRWIDPDPEHEQALVDFTRAVLDDPAFTARLEGLVEEVARPGALVSLAQTLLQIASPGVPDRYRGTELWDLSLADPDNRRPVDFEARNRILAELERRDGEPGLLRELLEQWRDGRVKLYVTWRALRARRDDPELFREGAYLPLPTSPGWIAFARRHRRTWALVAAPVAPRPAEGILRLPEGAPSNWEDLLETGPRATGREIPLVPSSPFRLLRGEDG